MSLSPKQTAELHDLLWGLHTSTASTDELSRLERLICEDPAARSFYVRYMHLCADLHWNIAEGQETYSEECEAEAEVLGIGIGGEHIGSAADAPWPALGEESIPCSCPFIVQTSPTPSTVSHVYSFLFSYIAAALVVGAGILVAWAWKLPENAEVAEKLFPPTVVQGEKSASDVEPKREIVGRITSMVDCQWADESTAAINGAYIPVGRRYALSSGLMEITYGNNIKVILQGPVAYQVESATGGYLSRGKLTARVEKREERTEQRGESSPNLQISKSPNPSPLFAVRTPTALVTDLGTEFGVEVGRDGRTTSHVIQGSVKVQAFSNNGKLEGDGQILHENEMVRVEPDKNRSLLVSRGVVASNRYVRNMPQRVPIKVFNTGVDTPEGQPDPHWQIIAASNNPNFRPRPATVSNAFYPEYWIPNKPDKHQWISIVGDASDAPDYVTHTFRTTFTLDEGLRPETLVLQGRFIADNHIRAIRLNGQEMPVPKHSYEDPFKSFHPFTIRNGAVKGLNVLEFDLENGLPVPPKTRSNNPTGLVVVLNATALQQTTGEGIPTQDNPTINHTQVSSIVRHKDPTTN